MKIDFGVGVFIFNNSKVLLIKHHKLGIWIPPGGHIDQNETPDNAVIREIKEELNLDIKILNENNLPVVDKVKENLATPFHVDLHSVGDHDHVGFYYIAEVDGLDNIEKSEKEIDDYKWFTEGEIKQSDILESTKLKTLKAFEIYKTLV